MCQITNLRILFFSCLICACSENPFGSAETDSGEATTTGTSDSTATGGTGGGTTTGGTTAGTTGGGNGELVGCGDLTNITSNFDDNTLPTGFLAVEGPQFTNGEMSFQYPATASGDVFNSRSIAIASLTEIPINQGRVSIRISGSPSNSNTQAGIKLVFGTQVVEGVSHEIVAELGRGPGSGYLVSRDGINRNSVFFDDSTVNWLSMRITPTTVYAEVSADGTTWTVAEQVPKLGDGDATIRIQSDQYGAFNQSLNITIDDLNTNCPNL